MSASSQAPCLRMQTPCHLRVPPQGRLAQGSPSRNRQPGNFGLETLFWEPSLGNFSSGIQLGTFSLGNLTSDLHLESLAWRLRRGKLVWELRPRTFRLELSLRIFPLGSSLGELGLGKLGESVAGAGVTDVTASHCLILKKLSKNPCR